MSNPLNDSTQLNDEQIEDLVREFSQFETNSQTFYESQTQTFFDEQLQQQLQSPNATNAPLDYQAEFLKCMFNAGEIECLAAKARANAVADQQLDYDSQTDVETVVQTYMTGNPDWNENAPLKPLDIEAFLETRDFFVTIKSGTTNNNAGKRSEASAAGTSDLNKSKRDNRFTLGPLPLEIEDVHHVKIDLNEMQRWNSYQRIYGQKFKTVMFYGRCKPCGSSAAQKNRNVKLYEVDDGSGMAIVHFAHFDAEYSVMSRGIERLTEEYALAQREGIPYLGADDFHPNKAKCKEMLQNVNMILNIIRRMGAIKQEFFTHGCKVSVIGRVFGHSDGTNHVFAYHMIEDDCKERDFEIKFKNHLISVYESKYLKYKLDGSICTNVEQTETTRNV